MSYSTVSATSTLFYDNDRRGYLSRDVRLSVPLLVVNPKHDMRKVGFETIKRMQKFGMQNAVSHVVGRRHDQPLIVILLLVAVFADTLASRCAHRTQGPILCSPSSFFQCTNGCRPDQGAV